MRRGLGPGVWVRVLYVRLGKVLRRRWRLRWVTVSRGSALACDLKDCNPNCNPLTTWGPTAMLSGPTFRLVSRCGGYEIRTREGLPPTRFPTLHAAVPASSGPFGALVTGVCCPLTYEHERRWMRLRMRLHGRLRTKGTLSVVACRYRTSQVCSGLA
jgi:hypothetical protein